MRHLREATIFLIAVALLSGSALAGEPLKHFSLETVDGRTIDTSQIKDTALVIAVMATWCSVCKEEAPHFQEAYSAYRDKGVLFMGLFVASTEDGIRKFAQKYGLTFPVGEDKTGISEQFEPGAFPVTVFVSRDGTVREIHTGQISPEKLTRGVEEITR